MERIDIDLAKKEALDFKNLEQDQEIFKKRVELVENAILHNGCEVELLENLIKSDPDNDISREEIIEIMLRVVRNKHECN